MNKRKKMVFLAAGILVGILTATIKVSALADVGQTQDEVVLAITEEIGAKYNICPELLQAMIFYESSNNPNALNGDCTGYMQVSKRWHGNRMNQYGVDDLTEGYGNIVIGTDYLYELILKYQDIGYALMRYNGDAAAEEKYELGQLSDYAENVLTLSYELERLHGK
jgi:soluble lytic murein transglycosylase-like protein